jgi:protein ImuB
MVFLITELHIEFHPEEWPNRTTSSRVETVRSAQPTLSEPLLEKLIRLRIEGMVLADPVVRLVLEAHCVDTTRDQGDLFHVALRRDPQKALAAIADVRAELGNDAVQVAELQNAHLPEEQFAWRRIEQLSVPRVAREMRRTQLARRILHEPMHLSRLAEDTPFLDASLPQVKGPYILSGGWWRSSYRREYYYLEDDAGRILWLYYDEPQKQWMLQGVVE